MIRVRQVRCSAMQRWLVPLATIATLGALAGCGSGSSITEPSGTAPAVTTAVAPTPTIASTSTPSPIATPPVACMPGQFDIALNNQQGAAGTIYTTFEIRNTSTHDCTENGYAHLQMLSSSGGLLFTTWTNDNSMATPGPVDLPPGTEPLGAVGATGHGYFLVSWSDASCSASAATSPKFWQITLPTSRFQTDVTAMAQSDVCGGAIKVGPIKSVTYT
jgi:Protein of unknown function (DUF4232)